MAEAKHLAFHDMGQSTRRSLRQRFVDQLGCNPQVLVHRHGPLRDYNNGETPRFPYHCISIVRIKAERLIKELERLTDPSLRERLLISLGPSTHRKIGGIRITGTLG